MNDAGFDVLLLVTRGHDELWRQGADLTNHGHAVEEIHDCLLDFQGAIETAADLGAQRVIVAGHSMGAVKTWYGAAHLDDARVVGAVTISTPRLDPAYFARLPWASVYLGEMAEARHAVEAGNGDVLREWQTPFRRNLMAPRAWLDHYESDRYAARLLAPLIDVPVLAIEADGEENVLHQGYAAELAAAHSNVTARVVTDSGHMFRTPGALDRLASEVASWLGSRFGDVRS
jgi:pimeloyl-ACP methyl ester carboxylesterase